MAGHNKWTQIKRQKGASDAKRSQLFSKLSRMISSQVKVANGDRNALLVRQAIEKAKAADMPVDTIERAISKATESKEMESITYEAYGPGGAGMIIEVLTDSRNRAA
ncbi:MAG: YebC/PmpR family DNA-binding transcriptional regulator, partial [Candidatus Pacebacteria bacterium]|nr:YebC/PmpR family DNA-binding transcriptional regulator [Candidatus Paceibacterota bacterium]